MGEVKTIKRGELAGHTYVPPGGNRGFSLKKTSDTDADLEFGVGQFYAETSAETALGNIVITNDFETGNVTRYLQNNILQELQNAHDAQGAGGRVFYPPTREYSFLQGEQVQIYPDQIIEGEQTVFNMAETASPTTAVGIFTDTANGSDNTKIRNIHFKGALPAAHTSTPGAGYGLFIRNGRGQEITGCLFEDLSGGAVRLDGDSAFSDPQSVRFTNNDVRNCFRGLFGKHGTDDIIMTNNHFDHIGVNAFGIDDLSEGEPYGPRPNRIIISNNTILNISQAFDNAAAIFCSANKGLTITGNTIDQCGSAANDGSGIVAFTGGATEVGGVQYGEASVISDNTIVRAKTYGIEIVGLRNTSVVGNTILSTGWQEVATPSFAILLWRINIAGTDFPSLRNNIIGNTIGLLEQDRGIVTCNTALRVEHSDSTWNDFIANKVDPTACTNVFVDNGGSNTNREVGTRDTEGTDLKWNADSFGLRDQKNQSFTMDIQNNAATLEVRVGRPNVDGSLAGDYNDRIINASTTAIAIPTVSAGVGFGSAPAGIVSGAGNVVVLNTAAQVSADFNAIVNIAGNDTGTALRVSVVSASRNINGTTIPRPEVRFFDNVTGAAFTISTANILATELVAVTFMGYVQ